MAGRLTGFRRGSSPGAGQGPVPVGLNNGGHVDEPGAMETPDGGRLGRVWRAIWADDWSRTLVVMALVGTILAAAGGFGTGEIPFAERLVYWLTLILVGALLGRFGGRKIIPRPWWETRRVIVIALMTLMIGLPMTLVATFGNDWIKRRQLGLWHVWDVLPSTLATTATLVVLGFVIQHRAGVQTHEALEGAPAPRFWSRLPAKLAGADLWAVEAEDHYLRLHTSKGDDLILMRLADALVELEGIEGARTHRSWWVARDAVLSVERAEGRATLSLAGGLKAPVSRAYVKPLREAGWF